MGALRAKVAAVFPKESERKQAANVARHLGSTKPGKALLLGPDGPMIIPDSVCRLFQKAARLLAEGHGVNLLPEDAELTSQEAADILHVSRPFVTKQIDAGVLRARKVGKHRRVRLRDVLEYRDFLEKRGRAAMEELVSSAEDLGLYDE